MAEPEEEGERAWMFAPLRSFPIHTSITTPRKVAPLMVAPHEDPGDLHGYCGGKDVHDTSCHCPDPAYSVTVRIASGTNIKSLIYCLCCELPFVDGPRLQMKLIP